MNGVLWGERIHMSQQQEDITLRLSEVRARIGAAAARAGRDPAGVRLVAVTKTYPAEVIREAMRAGLRDFGENKVQEGAAKIRELEPLWNVEGTGTPNDKPCFHLIGHLQTNKAKVAAMIFGMIHSVDSERLAVELNRHATAVGSTLDILLQVNVSGEDTKSGFEPAEIRSALPRIIKVCPALRLCGLMTMAPFVDDPEESRPCFAALRELSHELRGMTGTDQSRLGRELSMGMTNDYETAIGEGATIVRIGTALFGHRGL